MSRPPSDETEVAKLLKAAKKDAALTWLQIEAKTGIRKATREGWFRRSTGQPPLGPVVFLADCLSVSAEELVAAALADYRAANGAGEASGALDPGPARPGKPPDRKPSERTPQERRASRRARDE